MKGANHDDTLDLLKAINQLKFNEAEDCELIDLQNSVNINFYFIRVFLFSHIVLFMTPTI